MDFLSEECRSLRRPGGFEVCIIAGQSDFSARPVNDFIQKVLEFPRLPGLQIKKKEGKNQTLPRKASCVSLPSHAHRQEAGFCFLFGLLWSFEELLQAGKWPVDIKTLTQRNTPAVDDHGTGVWRVAGLHPA